MSCKHHAVWELRADVGPAMRYARLLAICRREYEKLRGVHDSTVRHLRKARKEKRVLAKGLDEAYRLIGKFAGKETPESVELTPKHYRGDGYVTCERAISSCMRQEAAVGHIPAESIYWWGCAFKYVWRMWCKQDPRQDAAKAVDCLNKSIKYMG